MPLAELAVIIKVSDYIGLPVTLLLLVAVSIAGAYLLKREGTATWRRMRETLRSGQMPTKEATDGALILFGGALLLTPGFITDVIGLSMLVPGSRAIVKRLIRRGLGAAAMRHPVGRVGMISTGVTRWRTRSGATSEEPPVAGGPTTSPSTELHQGAARRDADGSPGRG